MVATKSTVYKIVAKCLANNVKSILDYIISVVQSAIVPGRHITDNVAVGVHEIKNLRCVKSGQSGFKIRHEQGV